MLVKMFLVTVVRNDLKRPTVRKKWLETTCCDQERPETTYNQQETTWTKLQRTDSNFMEALYFKINQLEGSSVTKKQ